MKTRALITFIFIILSSIAWAQPGDPCPGGPPCDPDVPITGIEWLLAAGAALGIKRFLSSGKNKA